MLGAVPTLSEGGRRWDARPVLWHSAPRPEFAIYGVESQVVRLVKAREDRGATRSSQYGIINQIQTPALLDAEVHHLSGAPLGA